MKRKTFIRNLAALGGIGLLTGIYTWQVEPFWLEFTRVKMPIKNLPPKLAGKTLMQISDIHVSTRVDKQYLIDSFQEAQSFKPDYVVYTGDFISYKDNLQFAQLETVFQHAVTGTAGTLGILGNHDYGKNWSEPLVADTITGILQNKGITMLRNEQVNIDGLNIIGLDDFWGTNFQPQLVMDKLDPALANIVLCHNPDVADQPVWNDYEGWILSGHTHGGQCKPPFLDAPLLPVRNKKYTAGQIDAGNGRTLYINRALGHFWQLRFNVRPEITIFELEQA
jgi:uncharacterized protein